MKMKAKERFYKQMASIALVVLLAASTSVAHQCSCDYGFYHTEEGRLPCITQCRRIYANEVELKECDAYCEAAKHMFPEDVPTSTFEMMITPEYRNPHPSESPDPSPVEEQDNGDANDITSRHHTWYKLDENFFVLLLILLLSAYPVAKDVIIKIKSLIYTRRDHADKETQTAQDEKKDREIQTECGGKKDDNREGNQVPGNPVPQTFEISLVEENIEELEENNNSSARVSSDQKTLPATATGSDSPIINRRYQSNGINRVNEHLRPEQPPPESDGVNTVFANVHRSMNGGYNEEHVRLLHEQPESGGHFPRHHREYAIVDMSQARAEYHDH